MKKKHIAILIALITCIFICMFVCACIFTIFLKKQKKQLEIKNNMLSYLNNTYSHNEFVFIGDLEKGDFKKVFSLDGSSCTYNSGKYYRHKVRSQKDNIEFYVQYLTKDNIYEDTYLIVLEQNSIAQNIKEKIKETFDLESSVTIESDYDTPTDISRFPDTDNWIDVNYTFVINGNLDIYNIENIQKILELKMRKDQIYPKSSLITYNSYLNFNNCSMSDSFYIHIEDDYPKVEDLEKLLAIEKEYTKLSEYNDGYLNYHYNNIDINFNLENITITEDYIEHYTIEEFIQILKNQ